MAKQTKAPARLRRRTLGFALLALIALDCFVHLSTLLTVIGHPNYIQGSADQRIFLSWFLAKTVVEVAVLFGIVVLRKVAVYVFFGSIPLFWLTAWALFRLPSSNAALIAIAVQLVWYTLWFIAIRRKWHYFR